MLNDDRYDDDDDDGDDDDDDDDWSILADVASDRGCVCSADSARHPTLNLRQDQVCKYDNHHDDHDNDNDDHYDNDVSKTHASC